MIVTPFVSNHSLTLSLSWGLKHPAQWLKSPQSQIPSTERDGSNMALVWTPNHPDERPVAFRRESLAFRYGEPLLNAVNANAVVTGSFQPLGTGLNSLSP